MNIKDIAKKSGVSVATISRAINPETRSKVSASTLERVDKLIEKYSYTPNLSARNLNRVSTKVIGVVFPYFYGIFYHSYYSNILAGVSDALIRAGYGFKIILLKEGKKWDYFDFKKGEHVDGLIITHWPMFFSNKAILEKMTLPCAVISDLKKNVDALFVAADQEMGGHKAAEHLYAIGHRRFAVMLGSDGSIDGELRMKGFNEFLKNKGIMIDPVCIIKADYQEELAYQRVGAIFESKRKPTAIFCLNDLMAFGVLRKLNELKIKCPQDVSVVGFDNDVRGNIVKPALTTIDLGIYRVAQEGVNKVLDYLALSAPKKPLTGRVVFPVDLVVRGSTALLAT